MSTAPTLDRAAWLEQRRRFIGGSDSAAMFSEGYGCRLRLIFDKADIPPDFDHSEKQHNLFERGRRLEPVVAELFEEKTGLSVRRQAARISKDYPYAGVNMDRQILTPTVAALRILWPNVEWERAFDDPATMASTGLLECKTANGFVLRKARTEGLQPDYIFQMQHGLAVTGYKWGCFALLDPISFDIEIFPLLRDEPMIAGLLEETRKVQGEVMRAVGLIETGTDVAALPGMLGVDTLPEGDTRCASCLWRKSCPGGKAFAGSDGDTEDDPKAQWKVLTDVPPDFEQYVRDLIDVRDLLEKQTEVEDAIESEIKSRLTDLGLVRIKLPALGRKIRWAPQQGKLCWDTKALEGLTFAVEKEIAVRRADVTDTQAASFAIADRLEQILITLKAARFRGKESQPFYFEPLVK